MAVNYRGSERIGQKNISQGGHNFSVNPKPSDGQMTGAARPHGGGIAR